MHKFLYLIFLTFREHSGQNINAKLMSAVITLASSGVLNGLEGISFQCCLNNVAT